MTHPSRTAPSAAERAYRHLKQAILEQSYPGGQLVSEGEIAEATGVSRTPVREALLRLETEGLVKLYPKRGALIRPVSAREIADVIEARRLVELHAADRVWPRRAELRADLVRRLDEMRRAHAAGDITTLMAADRSFHAAVVEAAGNEILAELYHRLRDRQLRMGEASFRLSPGWAEVALTEHAGQLAALDGDDPQAWHDAVAAHIDTAARMLGTLR
ncbi:GntR family transcriptional regulator [Micromonospora aurantiaca]|uniref:GntR family transcriptional regulator n=1 Tax=Micromonospora TaxID=1873 RepID=UPI0001C444A7|nr:MULTISPECIES: GntR family transcriptional regulator [Micromonospora]ADU10606.1 transcriptional regulator, GntR family [Micromonospora sp. L5]MBC9003838.1 GntR family transcriptional regulator [Micromonospora aurantiaca]RNH94145.1 GntR family transcriptional regulator [Micromonospora aurantiaca]